MDAEAFEPSAGSVCVRGADRFSKAYSGLVGVGGKRVGSESFFRTLVCFLQPPAGPSEDVVLGAQRVLLMGKAFGKGPLLLAQSPSGRGFDVDWSAAELAVGWGRHQLPEIARKIMFFLTIIV